MGKNRKPYTEEELAEIASQYETRGELKKANSSVYDAIKRHGLCDKLYAHMKNGRKVVKVWTKEKLAAIASKYDNIAEFRKNEYNAYAAIARRHLYDELTSHMKRMHVNRYTDEQLAEIAQKYTTHKEFMENDERALVTIRNRGLYEKLCGHLEFGHHRWSDAELEEIASRYTDLKEFIEKEKKAYGIIAGRGLIAKLCGHMKRRGGLKLRKIYAFTFADGCAYIGLTWNPESRYLDHTTDRHKQKTAVYRHIEKTGAAFEYKLLTDWLPKDEASAQEDEYIRQYQAEGWKMLNRARGGCLGGVTHRYADKRIREEVGKYEYMEDFREQSFEFYRYLVSHRLLRKYCSHLKRKRHTHRKWTIESAAEVARQFKRRSELATKYYQAHEILKNAGLLDKYFPK